MAESAEYHRLFAMAMVSTIGVETVVLFVIVRVWFKRASLEVSSVLLVFAGVFCSAGTLPYLWFVLPQLITAYVPYVLVGEAVVWAVEAVFYRAVLPFSWKMSGLISFTCNVSSYAMGLLLL